MRASFPVALATAAALLVAGCGDADYPEVDATSTPASMLPAPDETTAGPGDATESATPTEAPAEPSLEPTTEAPVPTTDLPATALLPAEETYPEGGPRVEREGVEPWLVPDACEAGAPDTAVAMRTVTQGDGAYEDSIGQQQVAVFADVDAAVAEADRLGAVLDGCEAGPDISSGYASEPVAVGAQGVGLVVAYYDDYVPGQDLMSLGYVVTATRRGNAVTLVAHAGGEYSVGASRDLVVPQLQAAWERLCAYETEGC